MGMEESTCWDEHWVLYGNQFDNKFQKKQNKTVSLTIVLNHEILRYFGGRNEEKWKNEMKGRNEKKVLIFEDNMIDYLEISSDSPISYWK